MEIEVRMRPSHSVVEISDSSRIGEARRAAVQSAEAIGMDDADRGTVAIAVTELGTNLIKHAKTGKLIFENVGNGVRGLRVLAIDKGPGIRNVTTALEDGFSTSGTPGNGLGAVKRLSTHFDIYSLCDLGTCVLAEFWPKRKVPAAAIPVHLGVISLPIRGEEACGDGWAYRTTTDNVYLMVVDGLGHGIFAAEAAREAERVFSQTDSTSPAHILQDCHDALKKTRGAAAAIAVISREKRTLSFAGLGNISATLVTGKGRRGIASHNGTLGHHMHRIQEFALPWNDDSVLIMYSDGLLSRWDLDRYPGIIGRHPSIMAAALYRDFDRERDDVTVLVAKNLE
jgi:anti-sigma regulatory factor (Ser/Thr protein kinase)